MPALKEKIAIVTGASSGIGETTAVALAEAGARIALVARRTERMQTISARIEQATGSAAHIITGDVADPATATAAVEETLNKWGRVDILINNAGVMFLGPIDRVKVEDWRQMINLNLLGLMYFTHAVVPIMRSQKSGHVVNISSVAGRFARAGSSGYNASKWGVGAFSEALRQEVCVDKIRVTIIEPGAVLTELTDHMPDEDAKKATKERIATMEALTSEDISNAVIYAVTQPARVNVNEILIRPTDQLL